MPKLGFHSSIVFVTNMTETQEAIKTICEDVKELLLYKNKQYGNSALEPSRIFSKASAVEQLLVRIDDKLNRIQKGAGLLATDEDVVNDLIGYLVLLKISMESDKHNDILEIATSIYGKGVKAEPDILDHARDFD